MKQIITVILWALLAVLPGTALHAQESSSKSNAKSADVYHVFFVKAALGKAKELAALMKEPDPNATNPNQRIVLRHQDGDDWDFVEIEHVGAKATVDNSATPMPPAQRSLIEWHNDTFVSGPAWSEFAKAMGLDDAASKTKNAVYSVSDYRAAPGHRDALEKALNDVPTGDTSSGHVLLTHLEGSAWNYLAVVRYDSWDKLAENEKNSVAQSNKNTGGWFEIRDHIACHHDTLTDRILP